VSAVASLDGPLVDPVRHRDWEHVVARSPVLAVTAWAYVDQLAVSMRKEADLFLGEVFKSSQSLTDLLTAPFTFVDAQLAPLYGVVHLQPTPGEPPFVQAGQAVRAGQTLCVIEAMKVFNEVRAERDATVEAVLVRSGQEVEAGQALFRFDAE